MRPPRAAQDKVVSRHVIPLLFLLAGPFDAGAAQDSTQELRQEISALRSKLEALESRLEAMEGKPAEAALPPSAQQQTANSATDTARPIPQTLPARESVSDPSTGTSRIENRPPPTDPQLHGFLMLPGTETKIRIGGYAKVDAIYDFRNSGDPDQFITAEIPVDSPRANVSTFNMQSKQTRFSFEARRPTVEGGNLRFYLENDFFGDSGGGYQFRLRQAHGQLDNTYAGFGYSAFMDADSLPDTLDFEGPGSAPYLLQTSIRHAFPFGNSNSLTVSLEKPQTELNNSVDADAASNLPDLVVVGRTEHDWGHLQLAALWRRLGYVSDTQRSRTSAAGLSVSGSASIGNRDLLLFGVVGGKGISRYIADISGSGLDATVDSNGELHALTSYGSFFGYTHYWDALWRSNLVYGYLRLKDEPGLPADAFDESQYGALNLIWSPAPTWTMGLELLHGRLVQQGGLAGESTRLQASIQYSFIK